MSTIRLFVLVSLLCIGLAGTQAYALDGNDVLEITLVSGLQVKGWYYKIDGDRIFLSGDSRILSVAIAEIASVQRKGQLIPPDIFRSELEEARKVQALRLRLDQPVPQPWAAAGAGLVWAGAGPATLGDWGQFWGYSAVETVLLSGAAYGIFVRPSPGLAVPLLAVDAFFHVYSAADSARKARRARARRGQGPPLPVDSAIPTTPIGGPRPAP